MAAANGGNVEGTVPGETVVTANGVTIIGYTDLAGRLAAQASQLYGTNLVNLMKLMTPAKDGELVLDWDDVVQRGCHRRPRRRGHLAAPAGEGVGRTGGGGRADRLSRPRPSSRWPRRRSWG